MPGSSAENPGPAGAAGLALGVVQVLLGLAYPFLIWTGLSRFEPRQLGIVVLLFLGLRFGIARPDKAKAAARALWLPGLTIAAVISGVLIWNDPLGLLLMPVAISLGFLATFLFSLRSEQPMVERFARIQVPDLSEAEVAYCRRVTWVWCGFFLLNAGIAASLAATRQLDLWAFYTGFANYILMGTLFAGEYLYRHWRFRRYVGGFADPLLKRMFPPRPDEPSPGPRDGMSPIVLARKPAKNQSAEAKEKETVVDWSVPDGLDCWPGHFPEHFLLPGVLQLEWILREIERDRGARLSVRRIERLKFKQPVGPGDTLRLRITSEGESGVESGGEGSEVDERIELKLRGQQGEGEAVATTARILGRLVPASDSAEASKPSEPSPHQAASASTATPTFPDPSALLPHRAPMLWLDRVVSHDLDETICEVRCDDLPESITEGGRKAGPWIAIEWMAQCVAAHDGVERHRAEQPIRPGMLLGTKRLELDSARFKKGEIFRVGARKVFGGDTGMVSYDCEVVEPGSGRVRAAARLSCRVGVPGAPLV